MYQNNVPDAKAGKRRTRRKRRSSCGGPFIRAGIINVPSLSVCGCEWVQGGVCVREASKGKRTMGIDSGSNDDGLGEAGEWGRMLRWLQ